MDSNRYTVERGGVFVTVQAMSPVNAATGLYPDLRPASWKELDPGPYRSVFLVNGIVTVSELK